jgi:hypothetical protein
MNAELSTWSQLAIHFGAIATFACRGKLRPVHCFRAFSGICRAVAGR